MWLDGPDNGELVFGPRTGANYFHRVRYRGRTHSFETDGGNVEVNGTLNSEDIRVPNNRTVRVGSSPFIEMAVDKNSKSEAC